MAKFAEQIAKGKHIKQIEGEKTRQDIAIERFKPLADLIKTAQQDKLDLTNPQHLAVYFEHEDNLDTSIYP